MILVTGATGILGRVILLQLLEKGCKVRATKRASSDLEEVRKSFRFYTDRPDDFFSQIEWVDVNFKDIESIENALQGINEVYHCAATVSFNPSKDKELYETNVVGTQNLLYACEGLPINKFLFVSSIAVLDLVNEKGVLDEDSDYNSKIDHSGYAISKHFAEMEVWRASAEGLNTIIVNPGIIIGSGNWKKSSGTLFRTFEKNQYSFSGGSSYVDVRDVAKISIQLMEKNTFGERFVLISETKKYQYVADLIRQKLGLTPTKLISNGLLKLARISSVFSGIIPGLKLVTKANIESVTTMNTISNAKIQKELDFNFIPIEESLNFHLQNYIQDK